MRVFWRNLWKRHEARVGGIILSLVLLAALFAPWLAPHDPTAIDLSLKLQGPSWDYPLGTDHLGRCVLSRLLYGAQVSVGVAVLVMGVTMLLSLAIGLLAGYAGGWIDAVLMRICDVLLAFPSLVLALVLAGLLGQGLFNMILALILVQWVGYARIIRGLVMEARQRLYVQYARVAGTSPLRIMTSHLLPGLLPQVMVLASLDLGSVILSMAGLSFLGLGAQPPTAEWGGMISDSKAYLLGHPLLMAAPGFMIVLVVMAFNLLGDALQDSFDPTRQGGELDGA
ncbi:nickel transporter permease [Tumebacillus flagellatus]|uniref:Nickel transporter permease NikC n=1 Tax=Tumebacillus flagellatus TaxID=1157490 RepID=A0A074LQT3_9BACL|nr:nickel transporter permease [Tumebacillus flagellatus]KEO82855.1 nickel transporter permease NikC [Tumebacillus flagellatus]